MENEYDSKMKEDIEYLEKAFKKWTPNMLTTPYIPTPSILLKGEKTINEQKPIAKNKPLCVGKINPATKPTNLSFKDYEKIISFLHKGAVAYSMGDYGTAINYFTRLLETEWLKNSSYFYLIKTLIKLDIEKEILSLRSPGQTNNIRMKKEYSTDDPQ